MELNENGQPASIWDGWEKQFRFPADGPMIGGPIRDGWDCAITWIGERGLFKAQPTLERVANFIKQNYEIPCDRCWPSMVIVYANNVLGLTPDDFRRIDRLTAIEEMARKLVESAEGTEVPKEAECVLQS